MKKEKPTPQFSALRAAMQKRGVTQVRLAAILGVREETISRKMRGKGEFTLREAVAVSKYLGGTLDELFGDSS
ncbi:MAG: helix-turn-helix domain-containing protein [Oscillospiraceae bacterium]|nr:helix-turn-helix domain-containing protein [Oscillospiraceae bacterium]